MVELKRGKLQKAFGHLTVDNGKVNIDLRISFKEPRHLVEFDKDNFLITEINKVHKIEKQSGKIIDSFNSEWFSFLHTIELNKEKDKFLVASSGFDSVIEMSLKTKKFYTIGVDGNKGLILMKRELICQKI